MAASSAGRLWPLALLAQRLGGINRRRLGRRRRQAGARGAAGSQTL